MIKHLRSAIIISDGNFIRLGIGIGALYWIIESLIHVVFLKGAGLIAEIATPDIHELWKRILVVSLLILFGLFAQRYFNLQKRSERSLKESETKYRTIFEEALNPIFLFDVNGQFIDSNHSALEFLECTHEELLKKSFKKITSQNFASDDAEKISHINGRWILENDYSIKAHTKTLLLNLVPLRIGSKRLIYGIGQDITERKRIERTLKEAHAEMNQIFQTASVGMRVVDIDFNVMKVNDTFNVMTGLTGVESVNKKCYEIFSGPMCSTNYCPVTRIINGESRFETFVDKVCKDGRVIPCILTATPFTNPQGKIIGIVESFKDISDIKEAHETINSERKKLHRILSNLLDGVSIVKTDYSIEYQNKILRESFGECEGKCCYHVLMGRHRPCEPCLMREAIESGTVKHAEYETSNGRFFERAYTKITDMDGKDKAVVLLRDITEKKASLRAAMHAEQLAAVGELAAGVAHEINNPINGIINYAQVVLNKTKRGEMVNDIAGRIVKEGDRIARIVEGLLSFSRRRNEDKKIVSIKDILCDALMLTAAQMRKDSIEVKVNLTEDLPPILAQAHEIEQVFINIISNARHALNEKYSGSNDNKLIEICSQPTTDDCQQYVHISFCDHGIGIPASAIDKVKNPFFTTKSGRKSTGLGLSISHGILESHGGRLTIESVEGEFTRVNVDLPSSLNIMNSRCAA